MVIWLIGLAGAGKSTIGRELYSCLKARKPNVVFLDGDHVRAIMGNDLGHNIEDRRANAWRICRLCQHLDNQGIDVVCAILSIFHDTQEWNRQNYSRYFEVYIEAPMEVLATRDHNGLYSQSRAGKIADVVGFDIPFAPPPHPDYVVNNGHPMRPPALLAAEIVDKLQGAFPQGDG